MMNDITQIRQRIEDRSREKLRQRKQKKMQLLAVCVPLVLCLSLSGGYVWQAGWLDANQPTALEAVPEIGTMETYAASWEQDILADMPDDAVISEDAAHSMESSRGVKMELAGSEVVTAYMDDSLVHMVHMELHSIMTRSADDMNVVEESTETANATTSYRLKIFGKTTWEYILRDGTVTDVNSGIVYRATQLQWETICGLLDIPVS